MSGKSTLGYQITANATADGIPVFYMDHETSADAKYLTALGINLAEMADDDGLFFYSPAHVAEATYKYMHQMMDVFPDKNTSEFAPPQAIFVIDSFAAMTPEAADEDPDKNLQMAAAAKIHAWGLPLVKSKLHKKNICLYGTNQLRKKPGISYGNPEYEPGGEALTFFADLKLSIRGKGKPELERGRSLRHTNIKVTKNKQFPPFLEIEDQLQIAFGYGFDRFYDGLAFMKMTGQIEFIKPKKGVTTGGWQVSGFDHYKPLANKLVPTNDLVVELFKNDFRAAATKQMHTGEAFDRMFARLKWDEMYKFNPEHSGVGEEGVDPGTVSDEEAAEAADALAQVLGSNPQKLDSNFDLAAEISG